MKRLTLAAACAALLTLTAAPAFADDAVIAKLAQPVAQPVKFIAGGAMFLCNADACIAPAPTSQTFSTSVCKTIADKVGVVASFTARRAMDDARLATCNAVAIAKVQGAVLAKQ